MHVIDADDILDEEDSKNRMLLDRYNRNVDNTGHQLVSMKQMKIVLSRNNKLFKYPLWDELWKELHPEDYDSKECNEAQVAAFIRAAFVLCEATYTRKP